MFYFFFYGVLIAIFALLMGILQQTLNDFYPTFMLDSSAIGTNPGLGFRPMPPYNETESTLIHFAPPYRYTWEHWVEDLTTYLDPYEKTDESSGEYVSQCSFGRPREPNKVCFFDIKTLGTICTKENFFGYDRGYPCILLKLNRIIGWKPEVYESMDELPHDMPKDLRERIQKEANKHGNTPPAMVWVSCSGVTAADVENMGALEYAPYPGFPAYFFPYESTPGFRSPLIALRFTGPEAGVVISVECRAWAKNIIQDRANRRGFIRFELLRD
ncbi:unnamed protein product, partial [Darwinula stevensoni]